ncbi:MULTISPECIES: hypothetical protein [unclassified Rhizobacter]|uniref:hypothetical protein n=1 Tax=unclassified Rhizobacter TaxID=2640088 RepID=UPI000AC57D29|nr:MULTISPECIES: hypothetical protein [unclassified Rhizobacter]
MSAAGHARMAPDISTAARANAVSVENLIRNDAIETGALIAANGTTLAKRTGHTDRVPFTVQELLGGAGATFTHNHPRNTGPSVGDVMIGCEFRFHEIRVVTRNHRYMVGHLDRIKVADLQAEYAREEVRIDRLLRDEIRCNKLHPNDFACELVHRTWQRLSGKWHFQYRREES